MEKTIAAAAIMYRVKKKEFTLNAGEPTIELNKGSHKPI